MILLENGCIKVRCSAELRPKLMHWFINQDWVFIWDVFEFVIPLGPGGDAEECINQMIEAFPPDSLHCTHVPKSIEL